MIETAAGLFFLLLIYYLLFLNKIYSGIGQILPSNRKYQTEYVSVIVPFRNEAENIEASLTSLESQDYPSDKYEVIYINDSSTDQSVKILEDKISSNNVRILHLPEQQDGRGHKKRGIGLGIGNARGDIIVTTDADCMQGKKWLSKLISCLDENTAMVAGAVEFIECTTAFHKMQQLEFAGLITAGAGLIGAGTPIICNAANLAYRKKIFHQLEGFRDNMNLSSGDDELLMQKISSETDYKIKFCPERESVVFTRPSKNLKDFFQQRKRWASKGLYYKNKLIVLKLLLIFLFNAGILFFAVSGFFYSPALLLFIISVLIKMSGEYMVLRRGLNRLSLNAEMKYFILVEILHIPYIVLTSLAGMFGNFKWKERELKR